MATGKYAKFAGFKRMLGDASNPTHGIVVDDASHALHIVEPADADADFNISAATDPTVLIHSATNPATEYMALSDDATSAIINGVGATSVALQIDGTTAVAVNASELEITSGNNIQFLGNDGIVDSSGNEVVKFEAVGTAVNYLNIKNAATASPIVLECQGTEDKGFTFMNSTDEEILILTPTPSSVNEITIGNAATTNPPSIAATGSGANIGLKLTGKGTGLLLIGGTSSWTANGTIAVSLGTLGAAAIGGSTSVAEWFTVQNEDGSVRYIPAWAPA